MKTLMILVVIFGLLINMDVYADFEAEVTAKEAKMSADNDNPSDIQKGSDFSTKFDESQAKFSQAKDKAFDAVESKDSAIDSRAPNIEPPFDSGADTDNFTAKFQAHSISDNSAK